MFFSKGSKFWKLRKGLVGSKKLAVMASREGKRRNHHHNHHHENLVPLAALISRETKAAKMEKPIVRYGQAAQSRKGEDYFLIKTDILRVPSNSSTAFSVFAVTGSCI